MFDDSNLVARLRIRLRHRLIPDAVKTKLVKDAKSRLPIMDCALARSGSFEINLDRVGISNWHHSKMNRADAFYLEQLLMNKIVACPTSYVH